MRKSIMLSLVLVFASAAIAAAQACVASRAPDGGFAVSAGTSISGGSTSYGAGLTGNVPGPLFLAAGASLHTYDDIDEQGSSFGGGFGYELPITALSICPALSVGYFMLDGQTRVVGGPQGGAVVQTEVRTLSIPSA